MADRSSSLQKEIRQSVPFRSPGHEIGVGLIKTADVIDRRAAELLKPHGLTTTQYNVLRILRGAKYDGLCTLEVGSRMLRTTPGVSRMMDRLERKGWIRRIRSPEDRREVRCHLTAEGRRLVDSLDADVNKAEMVAVELLTRAEQRKLVELLEKVRQSGV